MFMSPGDSQDITVTITPEAGLTANVECTVGLPGASLSMVAPTPNPFTIAVSGGVPASRSFRIHWDSTMGMPGNQLTVTATAAGHSHTATVFLGFS
jgi:hypothetical protein